MEAVADLSHHLHQITTCHIHLQTLSGQLYATSRPAGSLESSHENIYCIPLENLNSGTVNPRLVYNTAVPSRSCPSIFKSGQFTKDYVGLQHGPMQGHELWACTATGHVCLFDTRTCQPQACLCPYDSLLGTEFLSFSVSANGFYACAGSDATSLDPETCVVAFWDIRRPTLPLGVYQETHSQPITSVQFHPHNAPQLLSASLDGLLCEMDLRQSSEDDALVHTWNAEDSVMACGWLEGAPDFVYAVTNMCGWLWPQEDLDEEHLTQLKIQSSLQKLTEKMARNSNGDEDILDEEHPFVNLLTCTRMPDILEPGGDAFALFSTDAEGAELRVDCRTLHSEDLFSSVVCRLSPDFKLQSVFHDYTRQQWAERVFCVGSTKVAVCSPCFSKIEI